MFGLRQPAIHLLNVLFVRRKILNQVPTHARPLCALAREDEK